jgi:hypothetical protein
MTSLLLFNYVFPIFYSQGDYFLKCNLGIFELTSFMLTSTLTSLITYWDVFDIWWLKQKPTMVEITITTHKT